MDDQHHTSRAMPSDPAPVIQRDEHALATRLRDGDETAFAELVTVYYGPMKRLALMYVPNAAVAEEVVQEAWLAVFEGINRFEGRSSLKTWIFRILLNIAMTRGQRENRSVPFSSLARPEREAEEPILEPERFLPAEHPNWPGAWAISPHGWEHLPEERLLAVETRSHVRDAIEMLPIQQRQVIALRDVEGWTSGEVCNALDISETNQRVLLHRARSKVRRVLERYLDGE
jgi:RNA polymerase sigma-70 factor, ECF subfamily